MERGAGATLEETNDSALASSVHLMAATQAGLEQLLRQAHDHVDVVLARHEELTREVEACASAERAPVRTQLIPGAFWFLKRRTAQAGSRGTGLALAGEARYRRLSAGFTLSKQHLEDVAAHTHMLYQALARLGVTTKALQGICTSTTTASSVDEMYSECCAATEELKTVLEEEVANQTGRKLAEFARFEEKLTAREQLRQQVDAAEKQLESMRAGLATRRFWSRRGKKTLITSECKLADKMQELRHLSHRLAVMTEALEHVFQFHLQLNQCIAEPELETVHRELLRCFETNANAFEQIEAALRS